ncbi:MAG TPA: tellurite resistance TerB family protein [Polyangium sp.]|nr:tellurite resistance TerB family protein [Polyangium sp.]
MSSPISLRSAHTLDEPKLEALIEIMYLAAYSDGSFAPEERAHFARSVQSLTDRKVTTEMLDEIVSRLDAARKAAGAAALIAGARATLGSPGACRVALNLAMDVIMADGKVTDSERTMMYEIGSALGFERAVTENLLKEAQGGQSPA